MSARIGRRNRALDALLQGSGAREAGFVTAWNPGGRRMPEGWNRRALARLASAARRAPQVTGCGVGRGWHEEHLLIVADRRRLGRLARRFRQLGYVLVRHGRPARIVMLPW